MAEARKTPELGKPGNNSTQIHSYPQNTKKQLHDKLVDFLLDTTEENFDPDKFYAMLDALDEADPMPEITDTKECLAEFQQKYAAVFDAMDAASPAAMIPPSPPKKHSRRKLSKLLPLAAVLSILLASLTLQSIGFLDFWKAFTHWSNEFFSVSSTDVPNATITIRPLADGEKATYDTLQDALDAFGIDEQLNPHWFPLRFSLSNVQAINDRVGIIIIADYLSENGFLSIRYREIHTAERTYETDEPPITTWSHYGMKHQLVQDMDRYKVYWRNGMLDCFIEGTVSQEEMKMIVDSIYKGE